MCDDKIQRLEQHAKERTIAHGRRKFLRREVGFSVVFFVTLMALLYFLDGKTRSSLIAGLVVLPIGILGGYLHAVWKWQDLQRR